MIYVNVEFVDNALDRRKEFVVALPSLDEEQFPFYPPVCVSTLSSGLKRVKALTGLRKKNKTTRNNVSGFGIN